MIQASSSAVGPAPLDGAPAASRRRRRGRRSSTADDRRLAEHEVGALVGVVGVDGHVGRAGVQHGEDGDVEVVRARGHADADAVAGADAGSREPRRRAPSTAVGERRGR